MMLEKLRSYISNGDDTEVLVLGPDRWRVVDPIRITMDGRPIELLLGEKILHLCPEVAVDPARKPSGKDWILLDPAHFYQEVAGFERLRPGDKVLIGRDNERLEKIFNLPKSVSKRHLSVTNVNGQILIKPLDNEADIYVSSAAERGEAESFSSLGRKNLKHLREIFGGPIACCHRKSRSPRSSKWSRYSVTSPIGQRTGEAGPAACWSFQTSRYP